MKITIDLENGSPVQEFTVDVSSLATVTSDKAVEVDVKTESGAEEAFVPKAE